MTTLDYDDLAESTIKRQIVSPEAMYRQTVGSIGQVLDGESQKKYESLIHSANLAELYKLGWKNRLSKFWDCSEHQLLGHRTAAFVVYSAEAQESLYTGHEPWKFELHAVKEIYASTRAFVLGALHRRHMTDPGMDSFSARATVHMLAHAGMFQEFRDRGLLPAPGSIRFLTKRDEITAEDFRNQAIVLAGKLGATLCKKAGIL